MHGESRGEDEVEPESEVDVVVLMSACSLAVALFDAGLPLGLITEVLGVFVEPPLLEPPPEPPPQAQRKNKIPKQLALRIKETAIVAPKMKCDESAW